MKLEENFGAAALCLERNLRTALEIRSFLFVCLGSMFKSVFLVLPLTMHVPKILSPSSGLGN